MSNVVYLHNPPTPVAYFLRVNEHRRLEHLLEAGKLPFNRFVIEAGNFEEQRDLAQSLRQRGHELALDTNVAELSSIAKYQGHARHAPWAIGGGLLTDQHLTGIAGTERLKLIAHFAVTNGFSRVLAPNRVVLPKLPDSGFVIDLDNCAKLRAALDAEGGKQIAIDFPLLISNGTLNDRAQRRELIDKLKSLPIDSIWTRVSGFGADATAAGLGKYISAVQDFHVLGKPLIADGVGGLAALAIVAFGAACGLSHGVAAKERFDASSWHKPPNPGGVGGGGGHYVLLQGIDRLLKREEAQAIIDSPGGLRLASCNDRNCCPRGYQDTIEDPKGHYLRQRAFTCRAISALPDQVRAKDFVDRTLPDADRKARQLAKLRLKDKALLSKLVENAKRLDRMRDVLGSLEAMAASATRSLGLSATSNAENAKRDRR